MADLEPFVEGVESLRNKLNAMVNRVNALDKKLQGVVDLPEETICVGDAQNTTQLRVRAKGITIVDSVGASPGGTLTLTVLYNGGLAEVDFQAAFVEEE